MARQNLAGLPCMQTRALVLVSFKSFGCNLWLLGRSSFVRKPFDNWLSKVLYIIQ